MNLEHIIESVGLIGVLIMVFAENGLLIGFFLPGDSLLFTAGFLASQEFANIWWLTIGVVVASIVGNQVGYVFGHRYGRRLFNKPDSRFFKQEYLREAETFYEKHGSMTIMLARFIPIVRTFAPIVAGVGKMRPAVFWLYNIVGGIVWAAGITLLGYWLGSKIPGIDRYLLPVIAIIIILSVLPGVFHLLRSPERRRNLLSRIFRRS